MKGDLGQQVRRVALAATMVAAALVVGVSPPVGADGNEAPGSPAAYEMLSAGGDHTCALLDNGELKCWGSNSAGQLGSNAGVFRVGDQAGEMGENLPAVDLGTGRSATAISAGGSHTCAVLDDGTVKCWGGNADGQLGQGSTETLGDEADEMGDALLAVDLGGGHTATAVSAGTDHTCALLSNRQVKCWGRNTFGQLGQGSTEALGDEADELGDNLPTVPLGTGRAAVAISAGNNHTCALLTTGEVKCWGSGVALGQGGTEALGDEADELGDNLPVVDLGNLEGGGGTLTASAITTGNGFTCALLSTSQIKCWGANGVGQLGQGSTETLGDEADEMGDNLAAVSLGTSRTATAVSAGVDHVCARLDNGQVKCWGRSDFGQLGQGTTATLGDGAGEMGDNLAAVSLGTDRTAVAVTTGRQHTCVRLDNGDHKCWGNNTNAQLGLGDLLARGDGANEMGDALPVVDVGDLVDPVVTLTTPPDDAVYALNQVVNADYGCTDEGGSGLASCVGTADGTTPVADGAPIPTGVEGPHTLAVTATDNADNQDTVTHDYTVARGRPDGRIRVRSGAYTADDIYNTFVGQTRTGSARPRRSVTYDALIQNDAPFTDSITVRGTGSLGAFTVAYRSPTGVNITSPVRAGTHTIANLAPGATYRVRIIVTVRANAGRTASLARTLRATSVADGGRTDTVKFVTRRA